MLGDFNQQTLLHNTRERFAQDKIYSFIGMPILIAVNPYKKLNLYNDNIIKSYKNYFEKLKRDPSNVGLPVPHLYHLAEAAYRDMIDDKKNQSIIISGESGSGKTESTKILLKYFAVSSLLSTGSKSINMNEVNRDDLITVEKQVLDSNPLLEAFGNAKTIKNNNSSRFGKFIQVSFTEHGKILSARIYNYLLEKSRIVTIQKDERNYHIFYQLLLGANEEERKTYKIQDLDYFDYLNKGCYDNADQDDAKDFIIMKDCMKKLLFEENEINYIFSIIMGILYLGNVTFVETVENNNTMSQIDEDKMEDFQNAAYFLGIDKETLQGILTTRNVMDPLTKKSIKKYLNVEKAYNGRDALAKALYAKMFDYIVLKTNKAISNKDESLKYDKTKIRKIGFLDIFGFENFDNNSFEQLCINYANERLQQYFNNHIFKIEQEEYKKEGIDWTQVEFVDNADIISLIDANKISIFGLLDSEGITPNSNDISFQKNVYKILQNNSALGDNEENKIIIHHFAGDIEYNVMGFVEKNLDQLTNDISEALSNSKNKLIKKLFETKEDPRNRGKNNVKGPNKLQSDTLSKQFKTQLDELLEMLSQSNPRYVKCIKPNSLKEPKILDSIDVMDQLLSAGVLEAVKIRKKGYSIRRTKEEFYKNYKALTPEIDVKNLRDYNEAVAKMLDLILNIPKMIETMKGKKKQIQVGHNKVFMKEEIKSILDYEKNRIKYINLLQSFFRGIKIRKKVNKTLNGMRLIRESLWTKFNMMKINHIAFSTIKIQRNIRHYNLKHKIKYMIRKLTQQKMERMKKLAEMNAKANVPDVNDVDNNNNIQSNLNDNKENTQASAYDAYNNYNNIFSNKKPKNEISKTGSNTKNKDYDDNIYYNNSGNKNEVTSSKPKTKKKKKIKEDKIEYANFNVGGLVDSELKKKLDDLKQELETTKQERDSLKLELEETKTQLQKEKAKNGVSSTSSPQQEETIKKLKKEIFEQNSNQEILTIQIESLNKSNKNLTELTETLKKDANKIKQKYEKEIMLLYQKIQTLQEENTQLQGNNNNSTRDSSNYNSSNYRELLELKDENKTLQKKLDDTKEKYLKEISSLKSQLAVQNYKMKDSLPNQEEYISMKKENELCKAKLQEMKSKLDDLSKVSESGKDIAKIQNEYEKNINEKNNEIEELKEESEQMQVQLEKMKKIEKVLRTQMANRESELEQYKKYNDETKEENEKLQDELMALKKETYINKSKLEVFETQHKNKNTGDMKKMNRELEEMRQKEKVMSNKIKNIEGMLDKKVNSLESKKKMNTLLIALVRNLKQQVHCREGLKETNSSLIKQTLVDLKEKEDGLFAQYV